MTTKQQLKGLTPLVVGSHVTGIESWSSFFFYYAFVSRDWWQSIEKRALDLYEEDEKNHGVGTVGLCWIRRGYYPLNEVILRNMSLWAYV